MIVRGALDAVTAVLFPAPCRICESPLVRASLIPICDSCLAGLQPLAGPMCPCCGRPYPKPFARPREEGLPAHLCGACRRGIYAFDCARSFAAYNDAMHSAILLLKYEQVTRLGKWFAAQLVAVVQREAELLAAQCVVPVPLHPDRRRERGYNQAELIARPLAKRLGLPLRVDLLVRKLPRPDRLLLSRNERWQSVRGAYAIKAGERVDKLRVLLVDDVFTTGATLDACSRVLRAAGAASIFGLTVARRLQTWSPPAPATGNLQVA
jgi:ComF family protein